MKAAPPKISQWILSRMVNRDDKYSALGDVEEEYIDIRADKGLLFAGLWYRFQVLISLPIVLKLYFYWSMAMFKNYLKTSFRDFKKYKTCTLINIFGLAVGLTCFILTFMYVQYELSFDKYHNDADKIFRVLEEHNVSEGIDTELSNSNYAPLAEELKNNIPEIKNAVRIFKGPEETTRYVYINENFFPENSFIFADPSILDIFTFPLIEGDKNTALNEPFSLMITQKIAKKYFGDGNPVGQTIKFINADYKCDFKITGVLKNIPKNSHFTFDFLASLNTCFRMWDMKFDWSGNDWFVTYIKVSENKNIKNLENKCTNLYQRHINQESLHLQPVTEIHLGGNLGYELGSHTTTKYIYIFSTVAIFILLIACCNYVNLSTARTSNRLKEIGLRKIVGAERKQLILQFMTESMILAVTALIFSLVLVSFLLPEFNSLIDREMEFKSFNPGIITAGVIIVTLFVTFLSGSYPAILLSSFNPLKTLRGNYRSGTPGSVKLREALVIFQFSLSIILIFVTLIIYKQVGFIREIPLGYEREQVAYFMMKGKMADQYNAFNNELIKHSNIFSTTVSSGIPFSTAYTIGGKINWQDKNIDKPVSWWGYSVDYNYLNTLKFEMSEGRFFSRDFSGDISNFVLNESAIAATGLKEPIGKMFNMRGKKGKIIGIVKDFHYHSLYDNIKPLILHIEPSWYRFIILRLSPGNLSGTIGYIKQVHKNFDPGAPCELKFLDEKIDMFYNTEYKLGRAFNYISICAILIACMGLFGLVSYSIERRTKEIGIRKVLGANLSNITGLISKDYLRCIFVANLTALPFSLWIMNKWLQNFAYKIQVDPGILFAPGLLVLIIALVTVSFQALKAAKTNPVKSLKHE